MMMLKTVTFAIIYASSIVLTIMLMVLINPIKASALDGVCVDAPGMPCNDSPPQTGGGGSGNGGPPQQPTDWNRIYENQAYNEGHKLLNMGDYKGAIAKFNEAMHYCHANCDYLNKSIAIASQNREIDQRNRQIDKRNREKDRGDQLLRQKDYDGAIIAYRAAWSYCTSYMNCSYLKKAIAYAERDREVDRAGQLWAQKDWDGSIAAYRQALTFCRSDMNCTYIYDNISAARTNRNNARRDKELDRAQRFFDQKDWNGAIASYKEALKHCPPDMNCDYIRDNISAAGSNRNNARRRHEYALHVRENNRLEKKANEFSVSGKPSQAEATFRKLVSQNPGNAYYANELGRNLLHQEKYMDAEVAFRNGIKDNPDDAVMHLNLSTALKHQGRYRNAEEEARKALSLKPSDAEYQRWANYLRDHNTSFMRHLDPVLNPVFKGLGSVLDPVFNTVSNIASTVNDKRKNLGESLQDDYKNVMEQASSAEFHSPKGSTGETAKDQAGKVFDTKGANIGSTISPLVVDGRRFDQYEPIPEEVRSDPEWKALDIQEKTLQAKLDKKEKLLAGLHKMRSDPKISSMKKAMVLVATANMKKDVFNMEHQKNTLKEKKKKVIKRFKLGNITEVGGEKPKAETDKR